MREKNQRDFFALWISEIAQRKPQIFARIAFESLCRFGYQDSSELNHQTYFVPAPNPCSLQFNGTETSKSSRQGGIAPSLVIIFSIHSGLSGTSLKCMLIKRGERLCILASCAMLSASPDVSCSYQRRARAMAFRIALRLTKLEAAIMQLGNKSAQGDLRALHEFLALILRLEDTINTGRGALPLSELDQTVMENLRRRMASAQSPQERTKQEESK
jgi:hypothetical protein